MGYYLLFGPFCVRGNIASGFSLTAEVYGERTKKRNKRTSSFYFWNKTENESAIFYILFKEKVKLNRFKELNLPL